MVNFAISFDKDVLELVQRDIAKAPETIRVFAEKSIPALMEKELAPIKTEPRTPDLPFIWSYDPVKQGRARRWYFANKVRGKTGGRYVRTHALVNNWKTNVGSLRTGVIVTVTNDTPGLEYVQGVRQVPSHRDSGWQRYEDTLLKAEKKANDLLIDAWFDVLDKPASGSRFK